MQQYIGICKKCGSRIDWDYENEKCVFHSVDGCLCECPYPANFMDWWKDSGSTDIGTCYDAWEAGRKAFLEEISEGILI